MPGGGRTSPGMPFYIASSASSIFICNCLSPARSKDISRGGAEKQSHAKGAKTQRKNSYNSFSFSRNGNSSRVSDLSSTHLLNSAAGRDCASSLPRRLRGKGSRGQRRDGEKHFRLADRYIHSSLIMVILHESMPFILRSPFP